MTNGFIVIKVWYYLVSLVKIVIAIKNPWALCRIVFKKEARLDFKKGFSLYIDQPLDVLIAKETICDDSYGLLQLDKPQYILDVGAAMGDFAVFAAHLYPQAKIAAFDPNAESFPLLKKNIAYNRM